MLIGSHARQYNVILFPALEGIDACHFNFLVEFGIKASVALHMTHYERLLPFIGSYDPYLVRFDSIFEEPGHYFLYVSSLGSVTKNILTLLYNIKYKNILFNIKYIKYIYVYYIIYNKIYI